MLVSVSMVDVVVPVQVDLAVVVLVQLLVQVFLKALLNQRVWNPRLVKLNSASVVAMLG